MERWTLSGQEMENETKLSHEGGRNFDERAGFSSVTGGMYRKWIYLQGSYLRNSKVM